MDGAHAFNKIALIAITAHRLGQFLFIMNLQKLMALLTIMSVLVQLCLTISCEGYQQAYSNFPKRRSQRFAPDKYPQRLKEFCQLLKPFLIRIHVSSRASGSTLVSASVDMKLVSPFQRGTIWRCTCSFTPAPAASPMLTPTLKAVVL